jgi:abortive infection bacteriophage resistance protein
MTAVKPFKEVPDLVHELQARGLVIKNTQAAETYFRKVGYFRSGAYRYVFRELLPEADQKPELRQFRTERYMAGSTLEDAQRLEEFDARLRHSVMQGLMDFEVRLRAAMAHVLARRDETAHADAVHLDSYQCAQLAKAGLTKFEAWERTFADAISASKEEDFVHHQLVKYGQPLPSWVTLEVLSFGSLPYIYELLLPSDQQEVARSFGVQHSARFGAWVRALVDLRNYCAHGSRLFNRVTKRAIKVVQSAYIGNDLDHLTSPNYSGTPNAPQRLYAVSAVLAYMLRSHEAGSNWHNAFKTCLGKLPSIVLLPNTSALVTPEDNMGFPAAWKALTLWN